MVPFDDVATTPAIVSQLLRLQAAGQVDVYYQVKNQARRKTQTAVKAALTNEALQAAVDQVRAGATQQLAVLQGLLTLKW